MELEHTKALVVGMGRSGFETASLLTRRGARVTISEMAREDEMGETARKFRELGVQTEFGGHVTDTFTKADFIVISPGVPHTIPPVQAAAIMLPILIAMDIFGLMHYRRQVDLLNLKMLLPFAIGQGFHLLFGAING